MDEQQNQEQSSNSNQNAESQEKKSSHLKMFTGKECDHCHDNLPTVQEVEKEHGVEFEKLEVWHDSDNAATLQKIDANEDGSSFCGAIPLYYNEKTGKRLCGPQNKEALAKLVKGE